MFIKVCLFLYSNFSIFERFDTAKYYSVLLFEAATTSTNSVRTGVDLVDRNNNVPVYPITSDLMSQAVQIFFDGPNFPNIEVQEESTSRKTDIPIQSPNLPSHPTPASSSQPPKKCSKKVVAFKESPQERLMREQVELVQNQVNCMSRIEQLMADRNKIENERLQLEKEKLQTLKGNYS